MDATDRGSRQHGRRRGADGPRRDGAVVVWVGWRGERPGARPFSQSFARRVAAASITTNGARGDGVSGDETAASCATFRLRPKDVWQYFAVAGVVDARAYHHDLEMSRCHAEGVVRFRNGQRGRWTIDRERRGMVGLRDGKAVYLYCPRCTASVFEPVYDPERDSFATPARSSRRSQAIDRPVG